MDMLRNGVRHLAIVATIIASSSIVLAESPRRSKPPITVQGKTGEQWALALQNAYAKKDEATLRQTLSPLLWSRFGAEGVAAVPVLEKIAKREQRKDVILFPVLKCLGALGPTASPASKTVLKIAKDRFAAPHRLEPAIECLTRTGVDQKGWPILASLDLDRIEVASLSGVLRASGEFAVPRYCSLLLKNRDRGDLFKLSLDPRTVGVEHAALVKVALEDNLDGDIVNKLVAAIGPGAVECAPELVHRALTGDVNAFQSLTAIGPAAAKHATPLEAMVNDPEVGRLCIATLAMIAPERLSPESYEIHRDASVEALHLRAGQLRQMPVSIRRGICEVSAIKTPETQLIPRLRWENDMLLVDVTRMSQGESRKTEEGDNPANFELLKAVRANKLPCMVSIQFEDAKAPEKRISYAARRWVEEINFSGLTLIGPLTDTDLKRISASAKPSTLAIVSSETNDFLAKTTLSLNNVEMIIEEAKARKWPLREIRLDYSIHQAQDSDQYPEFCRMLDSIKNSFGDVTIKVGSHEMTKTNAQWKSSD